MGLIYVKTKKAAPPLEKTKITQFHDFHIRLLNSKDSLRMSDFKGKKILCVNVASKCGYTPQYAALEALYKKYADQLVIIGFPCNQFLGQEPGNESEIAGFCQKNYGVTFPITEKLDVKGKNQHPIYQWLCDKTLNGVSDATVKWNFNKFLLDENGQWIAYFPSGTTPDSEEIARYLKH